MMARYSAQIVVVGIEAPGRLVLSTLDLGPLQLRRDGAHDVHSSPILQIEDVVERSLEAIRPQMRPGRRIDELRRDAHPVPHLAHATFEHVVYAQLATDLLHVHGPALVDEARIARDHEQPTEAR